MATLFQLEVVTPERRLFTVDAEMVIATTLEGEIGLMANHQPLVAALKPCAVKVRGGDSPMIFAISGGFMEMTGEKLTILAPAAERSSEIDLQRAEAAKQRAEERLRNREHIDVVRAEAALCRALARIQAVNGK